MMSNLCVKKKCFEEKHVDLSLKREEVKKQYVLIKDLNTFMYDHRLYYRRKIHMHMQKKRE